MTLVAGFSGFSSLFENLPFHCIVLEGEKRKLEMAFFFAIIDNALSIKQGANFSYQK